MSKHNRHDNLPNAQGGHQMIAQAWHGPLPDPQSLQHFKDIIPEAPRIIFTEFVEQGRHQRWLGKCSSILDFIIAGAAVLIIVMFALASFIFFWRGNWVAGSAFMATPVIVTLIKIVRVRK